MSALDTSYAEYVRINGGEFCAICGPDIPIPATRKLDRDHDHATGAPRGLLCRKHNRMLKRWLTIEFLEAALAYLKRERQ